MKSSEQIASTVFAIRDRKLSERKKHSSALKIAIPAGAAAVLAVSSAVVISNYNRVEPVAGVPETVYEYYRPTTVAATVTVPQMEVGIETAATTVQEYINPYVYAEPYWEDLDIAEQYRYFNLSKTELDEYSYTGKQLSAGKVGDKYGDVTMKGYDIYEDKEHETSAELYSIKSLSEDAALAVKYDGHDGYYIFKHWGYRPDDLGQVIDDLGLLNNISFGEICISSYYDGENRWEYDPVPTDRKKSDILKQVLADCRDCECRLDDFYENNYFSVSVNVELAGIENKTLTFYESGYMMTNIMEYGYYFFIGADKVRQVKEALALNDEQPHIMEVAYWVTASEESGPYGAETETAVTSAAYSGDVIEYTTSEE